MMKEYQEILERMYQLFITIPNPNKRELEDGWTFKQVIGHLIDSANNNHQRFVRYNENELIEFPSYNQNEFVNKASYDEFSYSNLLELFRLYNLLILHIINMIPIDHYNAKFKIGDSPEVTLGFLIEDYYRHLLHHEEQVKRRLNS